MQTEIAGRRLKKYFGKLVLFLCCVFVGDASAQTVWFLAANNKVSLPGTIDDSFVIPMNDSQDIATARKIIQNGSSDFMVFIATTGSDGVNKDYRAPNAPLWSWRVEHFDGWGQNVVALPRPTSASAIETEKWYSDEGTQITMSYQIVQELTISQFSHSQILDNCFSCHNGLDQSGKNLNHIATTNECQTCHKTIQFIPALVDHKHLIEGLSLCTDCHVRQCITSACIQHIDSSNDCGACHIFKSWLMVHAEIIGDCLSCHNNTDAIGKSDQHPATGDACEECHNNASFVPLSSIENPAVLLKDINPNGDASFAFPSKASMGAHVYFWADDGSLGNELWRTDGTSGGTSLVLDLIAGAASPVPPDIVNNTIMSTSNSVVFTAHTNLSGTELWISDGSQDGTRMALDIISGPNGSIPNLMSTLSDEVYFSVSSQIWKTDGTESGTTMLIDFSLLDTLLYRPTKIVFLNGDYYVSFNSSLWKFDATTSGAVSVNDLSSELVNPSTIIASASDLLYFLDNQGGQLQTLWATDGSSAGTVKIKDGISKLGFGPLAGGPLIIEGSNTLYFIRHVPGMWELWVTDGTAANTKLIKGSVLGNNTLASPSIEQLGDKIIFTTAGNKDNALWVSNGTDEGTFELLPTTKTSSVYFFNSPHLTATLGDEIYFTYSDAKSGRELWKTNGTLGGTVMVLDINPGMLGSSPDQFLVINDLLYFNADDGSLGRELWRSDGTGSGTFLVQDFEVGPGSSSPRWFKSIGNFQLLSTETQTFGEELWTIDVTTLLPRSAPVTQTPGGDGSGSVTPNDGSTSPALMPKAIDNNSGGGTINIFFIVFLMLFKIFRSSVFVSLKKIH